MHINGEVDRRIAERHQCIIIGDCRNSFIIIGADVCPLATSKVTISDLYLPSFDDARASLSQRTTDAAKP